MDRATHGKIKTIVGPGDIQPETSVVLVNTVYFKGKWRHPFSRWDTRKAEFSLLSGNKVEVDMMKSYGGAPQDQVPP